MQSLDLAYGYLCTGANLLHLSGWNGSSQQRGDGPLSSHLAFARRPPPGALAARC